jgi:hypothetical protein
MVIGYCVRCRTKREMKNARQVKMKNKMLAMKGTCIKCNTGMYKITGKAK